MPTAAVPTAAVPTAALADTLRTSAPTLSGGARRNLHRQSAPPALAPAPLGVKAPNKKNKKKHLCFQSLPSMSHPHVCHMSNM